MTGKERITRILKHQPTDRIGLYENFWGDTYTDYYDKGKVPAEETFEEHFNLDIQEAWPLSMVIDMDFQNETVREDEDTVTLKDGNGAILRRHKHHDTTPEHIGFSVVEREDWEQVKPKLMSEVERRINFEAYRKYKDSAAKAERFFTWSGASFFECMHLVSGHENLLAGMVLDPDWIADMAGTYAELIVQTQALLFEREGLPDGIFFYEDMGFKERPFMSPQMYRDLFMPSHKRMFDYAHKLGLPVIVHSCGFVEPLLPYMIEAGMDCLQVMEVKAGMNPLRIYQNHGKEIALMGGIDVRTLYTNDKDIIDRELESKLPVLKQGYGYIAHSDHSIPKTVEYETLVYYMKRVTELGTYE